MRVYRLSKSQYAGDLSGEGARKAGGRWNLKGIPVIYTSDSIALATLETLVHTPLNLVPKHRAVTVFELPDHHKMNKLDYSQLPGNWRDYPSPLELAQIGTQWVKQAQTFLLQVPSAIVPDGGGWNFLLNPSHPDFREVKIIDIFEYEFDPRLYKR
ncbi:MAG: RES family NAD+ phosphorylase [SAR324 cluster bacterium]|nr:RES family NAD+ phosphorylase [SAR324 cluster bacterium]